MKKIIFLLAMLASFAGIAQHTIVATPQESVVVTGTANVKVVNPVTVSGNVTVSSATTALSISASSVTSSGTVTAGAQTVLFETSSDFTGTINGITFLANGFLSYPPVPDHTWPAIPYVVTTGTLNIRKSN